MVVLMENFIVEPTKEEDVAHTFRIVFSCGDPPLHFAALSNNDCKDWCRFLSNSGLMSMLQNIASIRNEITSFMGVDPIKKVQQPIQLEKNKTLDPCHSGLELKLSELPFLRCLLTNLGLENLQFKSQFQGFDIKVQDGLSKPSSYPLICIQTLFLEGSSQVSNLEDWTMLSHTETAEVRGSLVNCEFQKAVILSAKQLSNIDSKVGFVLLEFSEVYASERVKLAFVELSIGNLLRSNDHTGTIKLNLITEQDLVLTVSHRQLKNHLDPNSLAFNFLCRNIMVSNFSFRRNNSRNPFTVLEYIGESSLCFLFPLEYLSVALSLSLTNPL
ncbi:hypothetical protein Ciccas_009357 [Cichlidogyrus casuarinus]|uniref:PH domain-containing protein n=1 Tax=Cichlidogyrus casuarinus TaxID=1844966 RepID=A0ABD2Q012_9PLAT